MPSKKKPRHRQAHLHSWARIDRASAMHNARVHLGAAYDLLDVDADFGLNALQQAYTIRADTRPSLTSFAALLVFHRAMDLLDGLSVLIRAGCVQPMIPLLRSYLESAMSARYLMTVNDERIAASYVVSQPLAEVAGLEERAGEHAGGSRPTIVAREGRQHIESMLAEDRLFREARNELARLNLSSSVPVPWFQAFGGPRTLGGLSRRLKDEQLESTFARFFDRWSAAAHVSDTLHSLAPAIADVTNAGDLFTDLRSPSRKDIVGVVYVCHHLFLRLMVHQAEYFREVPTGMTEYRALEARLRACLEE